MFRPIECIQKFYQSLQKISFFCPTEDGQYRKLLTNMRAEPPNLVYISPLFRNQYTLIFYVHLLFDMGLFSQGWLLN